MTRTVHDGVDAAVDATIARRNRFVTLNYPRYGITVVEGSGCEFTDSAGRTYLDLFSGFGGTILGHCHPELIAAATEQAGKLWHVGNFLDTEPQTLLAEAIATHGFGGRSCFGHSGSDSNEAAFKLVRLYGRRDGRDRYKVIATERGFHGRGFAAMNATAATRLRKGYDPFLDGFVHVPYNDLAAMEAAIDEQTAAIIVEPIQGEGGVHVPDDDYLPGLRALCDRHDLLLIVDEVWTGCGRTGRVVRLPARRDHPRHHDAGQGGRLRAAGRRDVRGPAHRGPVLGRVLRRRAARVDARRELHPDGGVRADVRDRRARRPAPARGGPRRAGHGRVPRAGGPTCRLRTCAAGACSSGSSSTRATRGPRPRSPARRWTGGSRSGPPGPDPPRRAADHRRARAAGARRRTGRGGARVVTGARRAAHPSEARRRRRGRRPRTPPRCLFSGMGNGQSGSCGTGGNRCAVT